ncbi:MAG: Gfo/Idh/MocA family oxidoreductase [Candidatus Aenigmatarchaeota archaeon]
MKKINLGIIGLGYIGMLHLRHSLKLRNANVVAVADASKKSLKKARDVGIRRLYTNYEEILKDPGIDAVIISLPTYLHLESARKSAEAKKHILLEKPIARSVKEAREIVSAAKRNSVKLMISYPLRFNTAFKAVKKKIESGIFGDIELAHATYVSAGPFFHRAEGTTPVPVPEWWFDKKLTGGGALIDVGCHLINLFRWYFGEITKIKSYLRHRFNMNFEDSATCLAKFESGTLTVITAAWFSQDFHIEVNLFGSVKCETLQVRPFNSLSDIIRMLIGGTSKLHQPHYAELEYFVNCIINDQYPSPSGVDGLKDLEAITKAYENQISLD